MKKPLVFTILCVGLLLTGTALLYQSNLSYSISKNIKITVHDGEGFYAVIQELIKKEPKISLQALKIYLKLNKLEKALKTGEYFFKQGTSLKRVIQDFATGNVVKYKVSIPEGYNMFEIAGLLKKKGIISSKKKFLEFVSSPKEASKHLGYNVQSFEGYLFPATYEFSKNTNEPLVVKSLVTAYQNNFQLLIKNLSLPKGFNQHQLTILASIIEKETGASYERPIIASVFLNRLKKQMRLQSDPTTIYGEWIETGERLFNIRQKHLLKKNKYNTYAIKGLPLGPISNPGYEAMKAVCAPKKTNYLYFVSKNDGTHYFSKTYKEHTKAVKKFQLSRRARAGKSWRDLNKKIRTN